MQRDNLQIRFQSHMRRNVSTNGFGHIYALLRSGFLASVRNVVFLIDPYATVQILSRCLLKLPASNEASRFCFENVNVTRKWSSGMSNQSITLLIVLESCNRCAHYRVESRPTIFLLVKNRNIIIKSLKWLFHPTFEPGAVGELSTPSLGWKCLWF